MFIMFHQNKCSNISLKSFVAKRGMRLSSKERKKREKEKEKEMKRIKERWE